MTAIGISDPEYCFNELRYLAIPARKKPIKRLLGNGLNAAVINANAGEVRVILFQSALAASNGPASLVVYIWPN
jgi:hypothetical protein